jgi:hypothetical protein
VDKRDGELVLSALPSSAGVTKYELKARSECAILVEVRRADLWKVDCAKNGWRWRSLLTAIVMALSEKALLSRSVHVES